MKTSKYLLVAAAALFMGNVEMAECMMGGMNFAESRGDMITLNLPNGRQQEFNKNNADRIFMAVTVFQERNGMWNSPITSALLEHAWKLEPVPETAKAILSEIEYMSGAVKSWIAQKLVSRGVPISDTDRAKYGLDSNNIQGVDAALLKDYLDQDNLQKADAALILASGGSAETIDDFQKCVDTLNATLPDTEKGQNLKNDLLNYYQLKIALSQ